MSTLCLFGFNVESDLICFYFRFTDFLWEQGCSFTTEFIIIVHLQDLKPG